MTVVTRYCAFWFIYKLSGLRISHPIWNEDIWIPTIWYLPSKIYKCPDFRFQLYWGCHTKLHSVKLSSHTGGFSWTKIKTNQNRHVLKSVMIFGRLRGEKKLGFRKNISPVAKPAKFKISLLINFENVILSNSVAQYEKVFILTLFARFKNNSQ